MCGRCGQAEPVAAISAGDGAARGGRGRKDIAALRSGGRFGRKEAPGRPIGGRFGLNKCSGGWFDPPRAENRGRASDFTWPGAENRGRASDFTFSGAEHRNRASGFTCPGAENRGRADAMRCFFTSDVTKRPNPGFFYAATCQHHRTAATATAPVGHTVASPGRQPLGHRNKAPVQRAAGTPARDLIRLGGGAVQPLHAADTRLPGWFGRGELAAASKGGRQPGHLTSAAGPTGRRAARPCAHLRCYGRGAAGGGRWWRRVPRSHCPAPGATPWARGLPTWSSATRRPAGRQSSRRVAWAGRARRGYRGCAQAALGGARFLGHPGAMLGGMVLGLLRCHCKHCQVTSL